jgi:anti-sigma-K factor RskA
VATSEKAGKKSEAASEAKAEEAKAEEAKSEAAKGEGAAAQPGAAPPAAVMSPERGPKAQAKSEDKPESESTSRLKPPPLNPVYPPELESAELPSLARRLRRWRLAAAACGLVAVALAALIALSATVPDRIPLRALGLLPAAARSTPPASATRLVAVLQQEPSSPAFLLTIDPAARTLTVRRVAAKAQAGHSYELWVLAAQAKPRALGLVGDAEYTQQPLPSDFNVDAMRRARYEISFESAGGSKSGAPTGPILFTGSLVESAPPPPPGPKS